MSHGHLQSTHDGHHASQQNMYAQQPMMPQSQGYMDPYQAMAYGGIQGAGMMPMHYGGMHPHMQQMMGAPQAQFSGWGGYMQGTQMNHPAMMGGYGHYPSYPTGYFGSPQMMGQGMAGGHVQQTPMFPQQMAGQLQGQFGEAIPPQLGDQRGPYLDGYAPNYEDEFD